MHTHTSLLLSSPACHHPARFPPPPYPFCIHPFPSITPRLHEAASALVLFCPDAAFQITAIISSSSSPSPSSHHRRLRRPWPRHALGMVWYVCMREREYVCRHYCLSPSRPLPSFRRLKKMEKARVLTAENTRSVLRAGHNRSFIGPLHAHTCTHAMMCVCHVMSCRHVTEETVGGRVRGIVDVRMDDK